MIIIAKYLIPLNYAGLTIYPFIFLKKSYLKNEMFLINHEKFIYNNKKKWLGFYSSAGISWNIYLG